MDRDRTRMDRTREAPPLVAARVTATEVRA